MAYVSFRRPDGTASYGRVQNGRAIETLGVAGDVALAKATLPLLLACSQHDPARFRAETLGLIAARVERHGRWPRVFYGSGHNHFSLACHLGTADTRLADEIISFIGDLP